MYSRSCSKINSVTWLVKLCCVLFFVLQLAGCASNTHYGRDHAPNWKIDVSKIPDAVPKVEPRSKFGNPRSYVAHGRRYYVMKSSLGYDEKGIASWYGMKFYKVRTSCGELYNVEAMTAAHRTLPLPTFVEVTNLKNGKRVIVKVNDRGPFAQNRIIDLSYAAALKLGIAAHGTGLVEVKAIDPRHWHGGSAESKATPAAAPVAHTLRRVPVTHQPRLYLQMGAFYNMHNAQQLGDRVQSKTRWPVFIRRTHPHGKPFYQVQIGPLPNVEAVDDLTKKLEKNGLGIPMATVE